ncbi:MAG TPA: trypsin-like serine protease [Geminicoccaceae bacterium]|nr:trypsin-like serine protease [Geminicoccus sp.]HMU51215.1 trypsin-like serine protease [Geminicoccaceae bacterium]
MHLTALASAARERGRWSRRRCGAAALAVAMALAVPPAGARSAPAVPGIVGSDDRVAQPQASQWPWTAIGRINRASGGFCTGTLVAEGRVLTAAHCLWNRRSGAMLAPGRLHFLAGWWRGRYLAHATAARIVTDPALAFDRQGRPRSAVTDWAVLVLDPASMRGDWPRPVPLAASAGLGPGTPLARAGYGRDRPHALSRQDGCHALGLAEDGAILLHDCDATFGDSGSPVLVQDGAGPAVAAVHVAFVEEHGITTGAAVLVTPAMAGP